MKIITHLKKLKDSYCQRQEVPTEFTEASLTGYRIDEYSQRTENEGGIRDWNVSRTNRVIQKFRWSLLDTKNSICHIKNTVKSLNRLSEAEQRISKLEYKCLEISVRPKRKRKN